MNKSSNDKSGCESVLADDVRQSRSASDELQAILDRHERNRDVFDNITKGFSSLRAAARVFHNPDTLKNAARIADVLTTERDSTLALAAIRYPSHVPHEISALVNAGVYTHSKALDAGIMMQAAEITKRFSVQGLSSLVMPRAASASADISRLTQDILAGIEPILSGEAAVLRQKIETMQAEISDSKLRKFTVQDAVSIFSLLIALLTLLYTAESYHKGRIDSFVSQENHEELMQSQALVLGQMYEL